jgi:hypothetical protein
VHVRDIIAYCHWSKFSTSLKKHWLDSTSVSTHDRYFLENVAQWILELDRGQGIPFEGKNDDSSRNLFNFNTLTHNDMHYLITNQKVTTLSG